MTHQLAARFATLTATLKDRREAGQNSLEYLGMALVAGVVIAAIVTVVSTDSVTTQIQKAWDAIVSPS